MRSARAFLAGSLMAGAIVFAAACGSDFSTQPTQADSPTRSITPSPLGSFSRDGGLSAGQYNATVKFTINPKSDTYIANPDPHYLLHPRRRGLRSGDVGLPHPDLVGSLPCNARSPRSITGQRRSRRRCRKNGQRRLHRVRHASPFQAEPEERVRRDAVSGDEQSRRQPHEDQRGARTPARCALTSRRSRRRSSSRRSGIPRARGVYRKIQHFSGYNSTGQDAMTAVCDSPDGSCLGGPQ